MKRNLDGSELEFEQDKRIAFEEKTHTYTVAGIGEMTPVSSVVANFLSLSMPYFGADKRQTTKRRRHVCAKSGKQKVSVQRERVRICIDKSNCT